jgi:hypothetical protein
MVKLSLFLINLALRHEGVWGSGYIDPYFYDLGTSWKRVIIYSISTSLLDHLATYGTI